MLARIRDELKELSGRIHKSEEKTKEEIQAIIQNINKMPYYEFIRKFEFSDLENHVLGPSHEAEDGLFWDPENKVYIDVTFDRDFDGYPENVASVEIAIPKIVVKPTIEIKYLE